MTIYLTENEVTSLLDMRTAIDALDEAFRSLADGEAMVRPRTRVFAPGATLNVMPASLPSQGVMGLKAYSSTRGGGRYLVLLYSITNGELLAVMEADRLGQIRTGAASGLATRYLSRPESRVLAVVGSGWQAFTQVEAVCAVRPIDEVRVYSRTPANRERFAGWVRQHLGVAARPADSAKEALDGADVVCTITSSTTPVVTGELLAPGMHVNAAGSNRATAAELDSAAVGKATLVVADLGDQAKIEAGDLIAAAKAGQWDWSSLYDLADVVAGRCRRASESDITLFESQGVALEDVAASAVVYRRAVAAGLGQPWPLEG